MVPLFSIKEEGLYYIVNILGLKLHIKSLKLAYKKIKELEKKQITPRSSKFFWATEAKFSTKDKIWYLSQTFYEQTGYFPNLKNPGSLNEKLNWLKLNYYNPIENTCIDKYEFKKYIKNQLGDGYTIPLIGVYDSVDDIDFKTLPQKFVMKVTISGNQEGMAFIKNKDKTDIEHLKYKFNDYLQEWNSIYYHCLSRGYKEVTPRIIVEPYIEELEKAVCDYKFFCFHGTPKCFYTTSNWLTGSIRELTYYDMNLNRLPIKYNNHSINHCTKLIRTKQIDLMTEIATKLSKDFPFVRIDFYNLKDKLLLGEMTFSPGGGFGQYTPREWDYKMGEWLDLNKLNPVYLNILPEFRV